MLEPVRFARLRARDCARKLEVLLDDVLARVDETWRFREEQRRFLADGVFVETECASSRPTTARAQPI
jgi:hypothetical protein